MLALVQLVLAQEKTTPAEEGLHIITVMLVVDLIFIGVIALGELWDHLRGKH